MVRQNFLTDFNFGSPDPFSSSRPKNGSELKTDFAEKFNDFPGNQFSRVQQSICDMANVVRGPEVQSMCHNRPPRTWQLLTSRTVGFFEKSAIRSTRESDDDAINKKKCNSEYSRVR